MSHLPTADEVADILRRIVDDMSDSRWEVTQAEMRAFGSDSSVFVAAKDLTTGSTLRVFPGPGDLWISLFIDGGFEATFGPEEKMSLETLDALLRALLSGNFERSVAVQVGRRRYSSVLAPPIPG